MDQPNGENTCSMKQHLWIFFNRKLLPFDRINNNIPIHSYCSCLGEILIVLYNNLKVVKVNKSVSTLYISLVGHNYYATFLWQRYTVDSGLILLTVSKIMTETCIHVIGKVLVRNVKCSYHVPWSVSKTSCLIVLTG